VGRDACADGSLNHAVPFLNAEDCRVQFVRDPVA
jgi:hypothetical protein